MKHQKLEIGHALKIDCHWYDNVPGREEVKEGEVIGWRPTQVLVRLPDYGVLRFWKHSGVEVGNSAHELRGWRISLSELEQSTKPNGSGIEVDM